MRYTWIILVLFAISGCGDAGQSAAPQNNSTSSGVVGKTTKEVVALETALAENKNLTIVENKVSGSDPVSLAATAYSAKTSEISILNFNRHLEMVKAEKGRYPSFEEYQQTPDEFKVPLAQLPPFQMYAYDEENGQLVILEDSSKR